MVDTDVGLARLAHRLGKDVGQPGLVQPAAQVGHLRPKRRIAVITFDHPLVGGCGFVARQRHQPEALLHQFVAAEAEHRDAHVVEILARLRHQHAADRLVRLVVAVPAHDHVVTRRLFGQHAVFLRPDMGQGDQRVALVAQRLPVGHGIHRVREGQPREILVVPRRMVVVVVVGHRGHEADPAAAPLDDRIGRRLGKGRRIAYDIGADDRKPALRGAHAQKSLSGVELVVAEGRHVVTQAVHQIDDRPARLGGSIAVDVARPAVARIDQNHVLHRIAALLDGFGQLRELLDMGVDVVGRKNHHRLHARRASRQHEEQQCAK